jgi:hypothetical protein
MTTFVVTFRNCIPAASTTAGRPSGKRSAYAENASGLPRKGGRGRQEKSPGPLATFVNGGFAPGPRARPGLQVSGCIRFERAKNRERSFGAQNAPQDDKSQLIPGTTNIGKTRRDASGQRRRYNLAEWPRGLHNVSGKAGAATLADRGRSAGRAAWQYG